MICSAGLSAQEQENSFSQCLTSLDSLANEEGVSQSARDVLKSLSYQPRVIELDRNQPEFVQTFPAYFSKRVNEWRINKGREMYAKHAEFLAELNQRFGIPGHYLMAFWGLETNFGGYKGNMPTLDSLATLACDPRRKRFFTHELLLALKLVDREKLDPSAMQGSWAGAMGHTQFMPSTYTQYAIDGDGDGSINLWESEQDALASAANFLHRLGWEPGLRWGREVRLPNDFDFALAGKSHQRSVAQWRALGVMYADGSELPDSDVKGTLRVPAGHSGPAFLTYKNFNTIMRWNNSEFYAIAVGHLADRIIKAPALTAPLPDLPALARADIKNMQLALAAKGYDVGGADGIIGPATREGIRHYQIDNGLVADGFPSLEIQQRLLSD
ncbi:lytic murein transglycosylase [Alteromonas oceanisediminis]|uniref:lytic murein transglycosylase n=1 Tax=Alteromonas oceanisediminis TaxID=2836180 RepID=UPI001BDAE217|nr:lytic murein transglycosylase [Alteromonas oceanisediminis]